MKKKIHKIPYLGYHTRAYVLGDLNKGIPLIILHGGPGGCVERYEPLEKLAEFGIPLIFYDQLGCGYSRVPKNHKISWNFRVFLDEFAHMLTVEFVRNGQYTVIPFPMKYLREYQRFIEKDVDFDE